MFDKLKLRLTLGNLIVAVLIFVIVFTGVYVTMYKSITSQSEQLVNLLTYSVITGGEPQNPKLLGLLGNRSFIIADLSASGRITGFRGTAFTQGPAKDYVKELIPIPPLTKEYVKELVDKALEEGGNTRHLFLRFADLPENGSMDIAMKAGTIQLSTGDTYLTRSIKKADGSFSVLLININYENSLLKSLRVNLIAVSLAGLALVFVGSLFMAGRTVKPIKAAWEKQKNFVADASHELRTPLSVIQTNLELVMENKADTVSSQYKWLENIYWENRQMTKLVGDLLLLARADSDQKLLEMGDFSLSAAAEEAAIPFVPVAAEKDVDMNFSIDPDIRFFGDEARIRQLVAILIDNAVKYTPPGGRIGLELKSGRDGVEMVVSDTGKGIGREDLGKIFERFYRADKARSSENGGAGLGLSIASWIVKAHHGTINADSALGKGTTFKVIFPKAGTKALPR